jgi:hypothetical protein
MRGMVEFQNSSERSPAVHENDHAGHVEFQKPPARSRSNFVLDSVTLICQYLRASENVIRGQGGTKYRRAALCWRRSRRRMTAH